MTDHSEQQRPQRVFHSVLASRIILNVRKASFRGDLASTTTTVMKGVPRFRLGQVVEESLDFANGLESESSETLNE